MVTVDFSGFRRAIDYVGCVYADIDRDYFNDQGGPGGYAVIDIDPGYQKLCGADALAYVRYRHGDNDLVRAARQQDFLRQVRNAKGTKELMEGGISIGNLQEARAGVRALLRPRQVAATRRRRSSSSRRPSSSRRATRSARSASASSTRPTTINLDGVAGHDPRDASRSS